MIGKKYLDFKASAAIGGAAVSDFSLSQYLDKNYVVLFFYPKDFSGVCNSEILAFQNDLQEFEDRNTVVVGCSVDSVESHLAWMNTPREQGGIKGVSYPLISDGTKTIANSFGVLAGQYSVDENDVLEANGPMIAHRSLFIIDDKGFIHHASMNFFPIGKNTTEVLRLIDAIQHVNIHGEACPANWTKDT